MHHKLAQCTSAGLHTPVDTGLTSVLFVCVCVRPALWPYSGWGCHSTHLLLPTTEEGRGSHVWHGLKAEREGGRRVTRGCVCVWVCVCVRLSLPPGDAWSIKFTLSINDLQTSECPVLEWLSDCIAGSCVFTSLTLRKIISVCLQIFCLAHDQK